MSTDTELRAALIALVRRITELETEVAVLTAAYGKLIIEVRSKRGESGGSTTQGAARAGRVRDG